MRGTDYEASGTPLWDRTASDMMQKDVFSLKETASCQEFAEKIVKENFGSVPIVDSKENLVLQYAPDGTFVLWDDAAHLVHGARLQRWSPSGYLDASRRPAGAEAVLLTPPTLVRILRGGWSGAVPLLHPSAR